MKMVFIVYNMAIEAEVMECLKRCGIESYTKIPRVQGVGELSGPHMDSHIWPGVNSQLQIGCTEEAKNRILEEVGKLRGSYAKVRIKAFVLSMEELVRSPSH